MIKIEEFIKMDCLNVGCKLIDNFLPYQVYRVDEVTDIKKFAMQHNVAPQNCICESSSLKVGDYVIIKTKSYKVHIVRPGESIEDIAKLNNISLDRLKELNIVDKIFVGQQLLV